MRAVTRALAPGAPIDALALAGDGGLYFADDQLTLAGRGQAQVLTLPGGLGAPGCSEPIAAWLATVDHDDEVQYPGTGAVAFGALRFERDAPSALVVPSLLYGRAVDGTEWVSVLGNPPGATPSRQALGELARLGPHHVYRGQPKILDSQPSDYTGAVKRALACINGGTLRKVVLARRLRVAMNTTISPTAMLARLHQDEPSSTCFLLGGPTERFLGASPELLISRRGHQVLSHPLAGTVSLGGAPPDDPGGRLLASSKDQNEHELVVADITRVLDPLCLELIVPNQPSVVPLRTMAHLGTRIEGRLLSDEGRLPSVLELVASLHPTPAVGGVPRETALQLIGASEPGPRGPWAGPVGWIDANGDGTWMVGLRSATVSGPNATIWAGAGIVAGSDPEAEAIETSLKLAPVFEGLAPGSTRLLEGCSLSS